jgi:hypothetical protein
MNFASLTFNIENSKRMILYCCTPHQAFSQDQPIDAARNPDKSVITIKLGQGASGKNRQCQIACRT